MAAQGQRYTPGPWRLFNKNRTVAVMAGDGPRNEVVSWTGFDASDFPKQVVANARLIAAAPELYETLRAAVETIDIPTDPNDGSAHPEWLAPVWQRCRAALAKAEG